MTSMALLTAIMCCVAVPTALATITRLPQWSRRRNLRVISGGALLAASFALMVPTLYESLDYGNANYLDLVIKAILFLALNIVCGDIAFAHGAPRLTRRMDSWLGASLLSTFMLVLIGMFLQIDAPTSSPALEAFRSQGWTVAYNSVANAYPAVIGILLAPALTRSFRHAGSMKRRVTTGVTIAGFTMSLLGAALLPFFAQSTGTYRVDQALNALAALAVVTGFVMAYVETMRHGPDTVASSALRASNHSG